MQYELIIKISAKSEACYTPYLLKQMHSANVWLVLAADTETANITQKLLVFVVVAVCYM